ncbi:hypothetical protein RJ640_023763 [Escallonia rubra]|uniref:Uncharacterized protein n=1 Tax=Escallonia rubra TaxID=112253 RepID=A0AA88RSC4_9ASTE|nr:hypothetical protein RJ640_023763 [Escallonia rubra]
MDIQLMYRPITCYNNCKKNPKSYEFGNRSKCVMIINSLNLSIVVGNKVGLIAFNRSIGTSFDFENPVRANGFLVRRQREAEGQGTKSTGVMRNKSTVFIIRWGSGKRGQSIRATIAKKAWNTSENAFKGVDKVKREQLQSLRVVNQLGRNGEEMEDNRMVEKIFRSLDPKFDHVVVAIEESNDINTMIVDELSGKLQVHEDKIKRRNK